MRGRVGQLKPDDRYGYSSPADHIEKKLDLNDLLKRVSEEKNKRKKMNILIFSGATFSVLMFFFLLSF